MEFAAMGIDPSPSIIIKYNALPTLWLIEFSKAANLSGLAAPV
jgi:hypothetical protein